MRITLMLALAMPSYLLADDYDCGHTCDLAKLVKICKALEGDAQIKPFTTEIKCGGSQTYWETAGTSYFPLGTKQQIGVKVSMKGGKYTIPDSQFLLSGVPTQGQCSSYKEFVGFHAPLSKILYSCSELEGVLKMGQAAYCKKALEDSGSQLVDVKETGKSYTNCPQIGTPPPQPHNALDLGGELSRTRQEEGSSFWYDLTVLSLTSDEGLLSRLGLKVGDRISSVNSQQVDTVEAFFTRVDEITRRGETLTVIYYQTETRQYVARDLKP